MDAVPATLSTTALREKLTAPNVRLIDARSVDAYNGWRLRAEARGGHLPGARSLPAKWTRYIDWPDIVAAKRLEPSQQLIVYGYDPGETERVAQRCCKAGFAEVSVYHDFTTEWSADPALPLQHLPRYRHLVPPQWLERLLRTGRAPEYDNERYVLCHAHYRNPSAYHQGHIPGAIALNTNALESPDTWNRRSSHELKAALEQHGITHDTTVIVYGRFAFPDNNDPYPGSSAGHLGALRCAMIMLYAGVGDVRVLNGGLQSWQDEGLLTTTETTVPTPVSDFGVTIPQRPELMIDLPEAKELLRNPDANLVSVRSWREFIGEVSGYNYIEPKGRIPGAVFGNCGSDAYHMENYRNVDHTTREYHEIEAHWAAAGVTSAQHNAFYCGTGWRGSEACFNAWLMGWPHAALYDGGWFEWSRDERNPRETGNPC